MAQVSLTPGVSRVQGHLNSITFRQHKPSGIHVAQYRRRRNSSGSSQANSITLRKYVQIWNALDGLHKARWRISSPPLLTAITRFLKENWHTNLTSPLLHLLPTADTLPSNPFSAQWSHLVSPHRVHLHINSARPIVPLIAFCRIGGEPHIRRMAKIGAGTLDYELLIGVNFNTYFGFQCPMNGTQTEITHKDQLFQFPTP